MFSMLAGIALIILACCIGAFFLAMGAAVIRYTRIIAEKQRQDADITRETIDWLNDLSGRIS